METISKEDLESLFTNGFRNGPKGHIISDCPFCGKHSHFYINRHSQLWDCKSCGADGNIYKLLIHLGKLFLIGDFKSIDRSKIKMLYDDEEDDEDLDIVSKVRRLPIGFKRQKENDYLLGRKLVKRNFSNHVIGITTLKPSLKDYVIFAVDEKDGCKGYVARYMKPIPKEKAKLIPRYRNDKGANFSKLLYGFDKVNEMTKTVILVEGIIDKLTLDNFLRLDKCDDMVCLATFGKKISSTQVLKILRAGIENVILVFDYDAIKQMKKFSLELDKFFNVRVGYTFNKDINDSSDKEIVQIFENLKSTRDFNRKTVTKL